jgi:Carboxypeptidase regulatory-like domain
MSACDLVNLSGVPSLCISDLEERMPRGARFPGFVIALALSLLPCGAAAQGARDARVQVTVVDPSSQVVVASTVTLVPLDSTAPTTAGVVTNQSGIAVIDVVPGRYSIRAEFPGFDVGLIREVRVRAGTSRHVVMLPLARLEDTVTVGRDVQEAAADRRTTGFGLKLSQAQIDALSDDPTELQRQILELAGPEAVIRVDSFEGQQLPPKAQIKSIHVTRDQFAAEAAQPGSTFVDVVTQPGIGPIRGTANFTIRDGSMTGRSQFTDVRGPEQFREWGGTIGGTIVREKTSFSASVNGQNNYQSPILNAVLPDQTRAETLNVRQPNRNVNVNLLVDHALTRDQTLRMGVMLGQRRRDNVGIGGYDLPERGFWQRQMQNSVRIQEAGPLGRRTFINTRLSYQWTDIDMESNVQSPAIVVPDAFTSGGAQRSQHADVHQVTLASDIDHVRGIHSWRAGVQLDGGWFNASSSFNYLGTYTFSSLDAYERGEPLLFTKSLGTPEVTYRTMQGAIYVQDDIKVQRGLTMSPGVRYSLQQRVADKTAFEPRFGLTWAPRANGATTLRASAGLFHSWLPLEPIEQTLRLNGERQREIVIHDPVYPDAGDIEPMSLPTSKYVIGNFRLGRNLRYSAGIDQVLSPRFRLNFLYNYIHMQQQARGRNLNAPVDGVRPDPTFANIVEVVSDAQTRRHEVNVNALINLAASSQAAQRAVFNWRRVNVNAGYSFIGVKSNSGGFFEVPPSNDPDLEWGRGSGDQPYRVQLLLTSTQVRNVTMNLTYLANAGSVYNWTTGFDGNRDGFLNDRPAGVGLRSLRGAAQQVMNLRVQYALALGAPEGAQSVQGATSRYRMTLFVNVNNLTNHQNLGGYSGVATSPYFRQATLVNGTRSVNIGAGMNF